MKKLLFFTSFLLCLSVGFGQTYNPANFTVSNKSYGVAQAVPTDARSMFYDGSLFIMRPYQSTAEVLSYLNLAKYRVGNFPIYINVGGTLQSGGTFTGGTLTEYWFRNGTTNSDLVLKAVSETDPKRVIVVAVTGTVNKTITLTLADSSNVTSTFTDYSADSTTLASAYQVDTAKSNLRAATALKETAANKGAANGYAPLNGATKIDPSYLPTGSTTYKGTWNASTNTPTLSDGSGTAGWTYTVSVAGTQNLGSGSITWSVGDQAIHNGTIYQRSPSGSAVTSVAGKTGTVVLNSTDVGLGNADNTSDANKPISTATQAALDAKVDQITGRALSERNYTPADSTKLAAITGTNTGDQDLSGKLDKSDSVLANRVTNEVNARAAADASLLPKSDSVLANRITNETTARANADIVSASFSGNATKTLTITKGNAGTITAIFTDSTGGGSTDTTRSTTGVQTNYRAGQDSTNLKGQVLGPLYVKNSWANGADFTLVGTPTLAYTGNKVNVSGAGTKLISATVGTSNTTLPEVIRITSYGGTALEKVHFVAKIKINAAPSGTTGGFSIGKYSISSGGIANAMVYFNGSTGTGTGTVSILTGTTNTTAAISSNALTFSQNDYIYLTYDQVGDKLVGIAKNATTGAQVNTSYAWDFTNSTTVGGLAPNTSNFAIAKMGGDFIIDSIGISSNETKNAPLLLFGNSKFQAYSTPFDARVGSMLDKYYIPGTITLAGQGDRTADMLNRFPEAIALHPQFIQFGDLARNDAANSVSSVTYLANIASMVSQATAAGIPYAILDGVYETAFNQATLVGQIQAAYPGTFIPSYSATSAAANLSPDLVHPSYLGAKTLAEVIYNSPLIPDNSKYPNGKPQSTSGTVTASTIYNNGGYRDIGSAYTPSTIASYDFMVRPLAAIRSANYTNSQYNYLMFHNASDEMEFYSSTASTTVGSAGFSFYGAGKTTTGTKNLIAKLTAYGNWVMTGGNVVGNSTPDGSIVLGADKALAFAVGNSAGQENQIIGLVTSTNAMEFRNKTAAGSLIFYTSGGVAGSQIEAARILPSGLLGVGVTSPTTSLHTTSFATAVTSSAVDISASIAHNTLLLTATGKTVTLPTAIGIGGRIYTIKLTASGTGTVATTSSQTIDGSTTYSLSAQYKYVTVQSDNANWNVIANN